MSRIIFITALILMIISIPLFSQIPQRISYQGILNNTDGEVVPDGNYTLTFKLYVSATSGTPIWNETHNINILNGLFNVILGSDNPLTIPFDRPYLLGIAVNSGDELSPRIELTASAYSLNAQSVADSSITSASVQNGQLVRSVNSLKDDVIIKGGENILITQRDDSLIISSTVTVAGNTLDGAYDQGGAGVGRTITADAGAFEVAGSDGVLFAGTYESGSIPAEGAGTRMMWYPAKAALRAGYVDGTQWDDANIGSYSTAIGINTTASGIYSTAMGWSTTASRERSTAMGFNTRANGYTSTAMGSSTTASGSYSTAMGLSTTAQAYMSLVIGRYNLITGSIGSWIDSDPLFVCGNGTSSSERSNALTLYKNGNLEVGGQIKIEGGSPGDGKVLTSDADGLASWTSISGSGNQDLDDAYNNGSTITADAGPVTIAGIDGLISTGNYGSGTALSVSGAGTRMMWYPHKAAFRVGSVDGAQWDDNNIGVYSTAMGGGTTASGILSIAMGYYTTASGDNSIAIGNTTMASGLNSTALGREIEAAGQYTVAIGLNDMNGLQITQDSTLAIMGGKVGIDVAAPSAELQVGGTEGVLFTGTFNNGSIPNEGAGTRMMWYPAKAAFRAGYVGVTQWDDANIGNYSAAMGNNTTASGEYSIAGGYNTNASGRSSVAMGSGTVASGWYSLALGINTTASGIRSTALGSSTAASGNYSTALGQNIEAAGQYTVAIGLNDMDGLQITQESTLAIMGGKVGIDVIAPAAELQVGGTEGVLFTGTYESGSIPIEGAGTRMMWYPAKAAFRAGYAGVAQWDDVNIGSYSTAMGSSTTASGSYSTAMGFYTTASGHYSTAMGRSTMASGSYSTAIGDQTIASGNGSTAMGFRTEASGMASTAMGNQTIASGDYSTAIGHYVTASGDGTFAIGDNSASSATDFTTNNRFNARFSGGFYLYTVSSSPWTGAYLGSGANSWSTISDSTKKENFKAVNGEEILSKISAFKLTTWNYKGQDPQQYRHYGPMAQDFYAAFGNDGVGVIGNDTTLSSADFDGINFIAVQALEKRSKKLRIKNEELEKQLSEVRSENSELKSKNEKQDEEIAALEKTVNAMQALIAGLAKEKDSSIKISIK